MNIECLESDIIEAIAVLTGKTEGDVHYAIKEGKFADLAKDALKSFTRNYKFFEEKDNVDPIEDLTILESCMEDLQGELEEALKGNNRERAKELEEDIIDLRRRIRIENQR